MGCAFIINHEVEYGWISMVGSVLCTFTVTCNLLICPLCWVLSMTTDSMRPNVSNVLCSPLLFSDALRILKRHTWERTRPLCIFFSQSPASRIPWWKATTVSERVIEETELNGQGKDDGWLRHHYHHYYHNYYDDDSWQPTAYSDWLFGWNAAGHTFALQLMAVLSIRLRCLN